MKQERVQERFRKVLELPESWSYQEAGWAGIVLPTAKKAEGDHVEFINQ